MKTPGPEGLRLGYEKLQTFNSGPRSVQRLHNKDCSFDRNFHCASWLRANIPPAAATHNLFVFVPKPKPWARLAGRLPDPEVVILPNFEGSECVSSKPEVKDVT
jgi:hypothetical protein